ncbi:MAG: hypothetical protein QXR58_00615 [Candidatus Micrarchaeaceae archaeon]
MSDETGFVEPRIGEIKLGGTLLGSFDTITNRLSSIQLFLIKPSSNGISLIRVESRDIQKRPFLFFIINLNKDSIVVEYSIPMDTSEKLRKLTVLKNLFSVLSLISDLYMPNVMELFQYADSAIDDVLNSISQSYSTLFNNYDSLFNEFREIKRLNIELTAANKNLVVQASQLSNQNKDLRERLKALETYSDESLMVMVQEWIESHSSTIDINEFAETYKLTPPRVEQILNKMVSLGYIEVRS